MRSRVRETLAEHGVDEARRRSSCRAACVSFTASSTTADAGTRVEDAATDRALSRRMSRTSGSSRREVALDSARDQRESRRFCQRSVPVTIVVDAARGRARRCSALARCDDGVGQIGACRVETARSTSYAARGPARSLPCGAPTGEAVARPGTPARSSVRLPSGWSSRIRSVPSPGRDDAGGRRRPRGPCRAPPTTAPARRDSRVFTMSSRCPPIDVDACGQGCSPRTWLCIRAPARHQSIEPSSLRDVGRRR